MPHSNYQHIFLCWTGPNPSSIQSGTINILQAPYNQNLYLSWSSAVLSFPFFSYVKIATKMKTVSEGPFGAVLGWLEVSQNWYKLSLTP